jgi:hypothetical protein
MKKFLYLVIAALMLSCGEESLNKPPTDFTLTISEITKTSATATWTEATDPEGETLSYFLYFYSVEDLDHPLKEGERVTVATYQFQDLEPDKEYKVTIAASDQSGNTVTAVQTFRTEAEPAPTAFTVTVSDETDTSVSLDWTESVDPEGGEITYSVVLDDVVLAEDLKALGYTINGLTPGASYSGKVIALNLAEKTTESLFNFVASTLNSSILMHYAFCGDAADVFGGNDGTIQGVVTPIADRNGVENCAYGFPGTETDYIAVPYSEDFNFSPNGNFSISLWYQGGSENGADLEFFVTKENPLNSPIASDYHVGLYDCNKVTFGSIHSPISFGDPGNTCGSAPNSLWHHIVAVYDQNGGSAHWAIYIDGLIADTIDTSERIVQSENGLKIGQFFQGNLDDIVFFSKALSAAEVQAVQAWD